MANENIITGRYYRILSDAVNQIWDRISFWNKASDTEADDGIDLQTKVGHINGITSDLTCEDESIAVSAKAVNDSLQEQPTFVYDEDGKITGYKTKVGADTVFPFSGSKNYIMGTEYMENNQFAVNQLSFNRNTTSIDDYQSTSFKVDLTHYNTIRIGMHAYGYTVNDLFGLGIASTLPTSNTTCRGDKYNEVKIGVASTNKFIELELDVSDISGEYYLTAYCIGGSSGICHASILYWKYE